MALFLCCEFGGAAAAGGGGGANGKRPSDQEFAHEEEVVDDKTQVLRAAMSHVVCSLPLNFIFTLQLGILLQQQRILTLEECRIQGFKLTI